MTKQKKSTWRTPDVWLLLTILAIAGTTAISPSEQSLGTNVRIVYLHGAWVWSALVTLGAAGVTGLAALVTQNHNLHTWSRASGRTGLVLWITYLPLSMWAMQSNWNGLFLAEPRWRLAVVFAISGLLIQIGVTLMENPVWASGANALFVSALMLALSNTQEVMHPSSPIFSSDSRQIQIYFLVLLLLTLFAAWQITRWWHKFEKARMNRNASLKNRY